VYGTRGRNLATGPPLSVQRKETVCLRLDRRLAFGGSRDKGLETPPPSGATPASEWGRGMPNHQALENDGL
jgi:hypothetical protein